MFFKYSMEINEATAKSAAKFCRQYLIKTMIDKYKTIDAINKASKTPELTRFLEVFLEQIETLNRCNNPTDQFKIKVQPKLDELQDHAKYLEIQELFNSCLLEIQKETQDLMARDRFATHNKIAKIKNNAVYTGTIQTIAMIVGGVLAIFNPTGLLVLGTAAFTLVLAESIFWLLNYQNYQKLNAKIAASDLEMDHAEGYAVPLSDLPPSPKQQVQKPASTTEEQPTLFSKEVENALEAGSEFIEDVASNVYEAATSSVFNIWSSVNSAIVGNKSSAETVMQHLHNL